MISLVLEKLFREHLKSSRTTIKLNLNQIKNKLQICIEKANYPKPLAKHQLDIDIS